jgi:succinoglycan biosynthesis protein ExoM
MTMACTKARLAICISTYRRPEGLSRLLAALENQLLVTLDPAQIVVCIADNDPAGSAAPIIARAAAHSRFSLASRHEPRKGLSHGRNASVAIALAAGATHCAFIDDDIAPAPGWLEALHVRMQETGAAAVLGPVLPVFASAPPRWLPCEAYAPHLHYIQAMTGAGALPGGYTCNALVAVAAVEPCADGTFFDVRYNDTGGEDTAFFARLIARGQYIMWAPGAQAHEFVPCERMRLRWLLRRWYRTGNAQALISGPGTGARVGTLMGGLARIATGGVRVLFAGLRHGWRRPERVTASLFTLARGLGFVSGAFGRTYREYDRHDYRA